MTKLLIVFLKNSWLYFVLWLTMENENIKLNNKITLDFALLWTESTCKIKYVLKHKGVILILSCSQTHFYYCSSYTKGYSMNGMLNYRDYGSENIKGKTWEFHQFVCHLVIIQHSLWSTSRKSVQERKREENNIFRDIKSWWLITME